MHSRVRQVGEFQMYIILHDNDPSTTDFIHFLNANKTKNYRAIRLDELIQNVEIVDELYEKNSSCNWSVKDEDINFDKVSGLYNRIKWINVNHFDDYIEEDREYVQQEWWAYVVFRVNRTVNAINTYTPEILSGQIYQFPFYYDAARKVGLTTPRYIVSTRRGDHLEFCNNHQFISRGSIYENADFRQSYNIADNCVASIEYQNGQSIIVHLIDEEIFACSVDKEGHSDIKLDGTLANNLLALRDRLGVRALQVYLRKTDHGDYIIYYVSTLPNWMHNSSTNREKIYETLHAKLSNSY